MVEEKPSAWPSLIDAQKESSPQPNDSLREKLAREASLFKGLPAKSIDIGAQYVEDAPELAAESAAVTFAVTALLAGAAKNPGILGKEAVPLTRGLVENAPAVFGTLFAADVATRFASPMYKAWQSPNNLDEARDELAVNVGTGLVDYSAGLLGGGMGMVAGYKMTPNWINKPPTFDLKPSLKLGETAREVTEPESFSTKREPKVAEDVVALYEKSFPKEERQPTAEVKELVGTGKIVVHATRDGTGQLHSFSFVSMHDESPFKFANLDFIATEPGAQSKGLGSLHAKRLNHLVKQENPTFAGMTLEMEAPAEPGLEADVLATRLRRAKFYDRLDAPNTNVKYHIFDFEDPSYRGPADWRAWVFKPDEFDAVRAARLLMTDEAGYGLKLNGKEVKEFDRANNFWEAKVSQVAALSASGMPIASMIGQIGGKGK